MSEPRAHLHMVPFHMHEAICSWIEDPVHPKLLGSFLYALLTNDLSGAFGHADDRNAAAMRNWVRFLCNHCPGPCWGSPEKVTAWHALHAEHKARVGAT